MGYIHELRQELEGIIGDQLDGETKKTVLNFVGKKVYDSWKNGVEHGKAEAQSGQTPQPQQESAAGN